MENLNYYKISHYEPYDDSDDIAEEIIDYSLKLIEEGEMK